MTPLESKRETAALENLLQSMAAENTASATSLGDHPSEQTNFHSFPIALPLPTFKPHPFSRDDHGCPLHYFWMDHAVARTQGTSKGQKFMSYSVCMHVNSVGYNRGWQAGHLLDRYSSQLLAILISKLFCVSLRPLQVGFLFLVHCPHHEIMRELRMRSTTKHDQQQKPQKQEGEN